MKPMPRIAEPVQLFQQDLERLLDQRQLCPRLRQAALARGKAQPCLRLAHAWAGRRSTSCELPREELEEAFKGDHSEIGRPALPIHLMAGLF